VTVRANRNHQTSPAKKMSSIISSAERPGENGARNNLPIFLARGLLQKANENGLNSTIVALQELLGASAHSAPIAFKPRADRALLMKHVANDGKT
jgi:hypothetical protein